ncbi:DUF3108 domain-containing protein [Undibacterium sp. Di26W]|uniref:DUF3108 domain-containing protein n=1 Tax=Undibacterium sp. Di26W TaxID=3413035 RepID=UPI003BF1FE80
MNPTFKPADYSLLNRQGLAFCALALLLHLLVLFNLNNTPVVGKPLHTEQIVRVHLRESVAPAPEAAHTNPTPTTARLRPVSAATRTHTTPFVQAQDKPPLPVSEVMEKTSLPVPDTTALLTDNTPPIEVARETLPAPAKPAAEGEPAYAVRPPPTGAIMMRIVRTENNRHPVNGQGEIHWDFENGQYKMRVEASLNLLITSLNLYTLRSEGKQDSYGIAPALSTETRRSRSETATHFNQDERTVSFSSSNKTSSVNQGVQDKASVMMQLAGIAYADPEKFQAGREIRLQVAEDRDVSNFVFVVIGQEEIDTPMGKIMTWHVNRPPRPGSYNSRLEIWLAPDYYWYPVQIRNTESNGAITTQTADKIISSK